MSILNLTYDWDSIRLRYTNAPSTYVLPLDDTIAIIENRAEEKQITLSEDNITQTCTYIRHAWKSSPDMKEQLAFVLTANTPRNISKPDLIPDTTHITSLREKKSHKKNLLTVRGFLKDQETLKDKFWSFIIKNIDEFLEKINHKGVHSHGYN